MKKVDRAEVENSNLKVWCEHCSIRIAPNESRVASGARSTISTVTKNIVLPIRR